MGRIMSCPRAAVCGISSRGPFCGPTVHPPLGAACFPSAKAFVQDWLVTQRLYSFGLPRLVQARCRPVGCCRTRELACTGLAGHSASICFWLASHGLGGDHLAVQRPSSRGIVLGVRKIVCVSDRDTHRFDEGRTVIASSRSRSSLP